MNNYRGITLKSHNLKIFESLMINRMRKWLADSNELPPEQVAYLPGRQTTDHIYTLNYLKCEAKRLGKKLHICAVDFAKAFPSINRELLIAELRRMQLSDKYINIFEKLYANDTYKIMAEGEIGEKQCHCKKGVHEGSCASPTLFITFIRSIVRYLKSKSASRKSPYLPGFGRVVLLLYADDILIISYSSKALQKLIKFTHMYCSAKSLVINENKTDCMTFFSDQPMQWRIGNSNKAGCTTVRYLGIHFNNDGNWHTQIEQLVPRVQLAVGRTKIMTATLGWPRIEISSNFYDSMASSIMRYSLGSWGPHAPMIAQFDNFFVNFIKHILPLPKNTSKNGILAQLGRRCTICDALYLATIHLARGLTNPKSIWGKICRYEIDQKDQTNNEWFVKVLSAAREREILDEVIQSPEMVVGERKNYAIYFDQYCYHKHLNILTNNSADDFRLGRPPGAYPFIHHLKSFQVRTVLQFTLSCWKWTKAFKKSKFPRSTCPRCRSHLSSSHLLFHCDYSEYFRKKFKRNTGTKACLNSLLIDSRDISLELYKLCDNVSRFVIPIFAF